MTPSTAPLLPSDNAKTHGSNPRYNMKKCGLSYINLL